MAKKEYRIATGKTRIASTSGHVFYLTEEFTAVPEECEPEVIRAGGISREQWEAIVAQVNKDNDNDKQPPPAPEPGSVEWYADIMVKMYQDDPAGNYTEEGLPDKRKLRSYSDLSEWCPDDVYDAAWKIAVKKIDLVIGDDGSGTGTEDNQ